MERTIEQKTRIPDPTVYWIRVKVYRAANRKKRNADANDILQAVYRHPCTESCEMVTDEGLLNLIGAGIREAFAGESGEVEDIQ